MGTRVLSVYKLEVEGMKRERESRRPKRQSENGGKRPKFGEKNI